MTATQFTMNDIDTPRVGWWNQPFQMFQTNLREIDAGLDVDRALDAIQTHGAGVWLLNVGGIVSHYPTDLDFQTRNPALADRVSGDLVGDAITKAHDRGVKLLARMDFSKIDGQIAAAHPEWCFRSVTGAQQRYEGLVSVCPSGGYYQERTLDILDEVLQRYPVDGFFFNWFGFNEVDYGGVVHGVCHCDSCSQAFTAYTGITKLPAGADDASYLDWKRFTAHTIDALTTRIRGHIQDRRPDAGLILGRSADILFHEANSALGRKLWPHATSESVGAFRIAQPQKPVLVNAVAFYDMPYRMTGEQPEMFAQYLTQAIARGANPSTYIMAAPGQINYDCLPAATVVTQFHSEHADVYDRLSPVAAVGLVRPDPLSREPVRHAEALAEFRGQFSALQERHIPFDIVPAESLGTVSLENFRVLLLPDLGVLNHSQDAVLDSFVSVGGRVLATGSTGISDDGGVASWLPAARRTAVIDDSQALKSSYLQTVDASAVEGSSLIPRFGTQLCFQWRDDTRHGHRVIPAAPYGPPEKAHGHVQSDEFACGTRDYGHGQAIQLQWLPGTTYTKLCLTNVRDAYIDLVTSLLSHDAQVEVKASDQVEVILGRSNAGFVLHLLNHSGQRRNGFASIVPIPNIEVRILGAAEGSARALLAPEETQITVDGNDLVIELGALHQFEVVVVENRRAS